MHTVTRSQAKLTLHRLIDESAKSHQPILITGERNNAVLISEEDWTSIQESIHLLSTPGMRESIREGIAAPIDDCTSKLDW